MRQLGKQDWSFLNGKTITSQFQHDIARHAHQDTLLGRDECIPTEDKEVAARSLQHLLLLINEQCIGSSTTRSFLKGAYSSLIIGRFCLRRDTLQVRRNQLDA